MKKRDKKAQVTVFVILGLAIAIVLVLIFINRGSFSLDSKNTNPISRIQECAETSVKEAAELVSKQGGSLEPELYYIFQGEKIQYTCYTEEYYQTCVMQKPLLKQDIEKEIVKYSELKIKNCISNVISDLETEGYSVEVSKIAPKVNLIPGRILIDIGSKLTISKSRTDNYNNVKTEIDSNLYDLVMVASSISNYEARYGDSDTTAYMIYYPNLRIQKYKQSEGTSIYIITDKNSLEEFKFASKSLVWPVGVTGN